MAKGNSRRWARSPMTDWLPAVGSVIFDRKTFRLDDVKASPTNDWIVSLAWAMHDKMNDTMQFKMVLKAYTFLRHIMPQGLTGEFGHLRGDEVMHHLLCSSKDDHVSRHKLTKDLDAVFDHLEKWMTGGNWKEGLQNAKADIHRSTWQAPGLHTPEGILSILILSHLSHPNWKWKARMQQLQIEWMLEPRDESLNVRDGYWKGMDSANLYVFSPAETRRAEVPLLANYTRLWGESFTQSQRDIRPFLEPWAQNNLTIVDGHSENGTDLDINDSSMRDAENGSRYSSPSPMSPQPTLEVVATPIPALIRSPLSRFSPTYSAAKASSAHYPIASPTLSSKTTRHSPSRHLVRASKPRTASRAISTPDAGDHAGRGTVTASQSMDPFAKSSVGSVKRDASYDIDGRNAKMPKLDSLRGELEAKLNLLKEEWREELEAKLNLLKEEWRAELEADRESYRSQMRTNFDELTACSRDSTRAFGEIRERLGTLALILNEPNEAQSLVLTQADHRNSVIAEIEAMQDAATDGIEAILKVERASTPPRTIRMPFDPL